MAVLHHLKCWPVPFEAVRSGQKHHEIRPDDRNFAVGDTLRLHEWSPVSQSYSGRALTVQVTYKTDGGSWGLPPGLCVLSIEHSASVSDSVGPNAHLISRAGQIACGDYSEQDTAIFVYDVAEVTCSACLRTQPVGVAGII